MARLLAILFAFCISGAAAFVAPVVQLRGAQSLQQSSRLAADASMMAGALTKPQRVNKRNREYNKNYRSEMRTRIKTVRGAHALSRHRRHRRAQHHPAPREPHLIGADLETPPFPSRR